MTKKLEHDVAAARMRERGAEPQEEYPGSQNKWHCRCMGCGADIWPRYNSVVYKGQGPCKPCGDRKVGQALSMPHDQAVAFMLERDFQPSVPYPGSKKPWPGVCLKCGQPGSTRLKNIHSGRVPCGNCAPGGYQNSKTGYFYFVAGKDWIKGGITNDANRRLAKHKAQGLTQVLHLWECTDGSIPQILEDLWLEHLTTVPDTDRPEKAEIKDGFTEAVRRTAPLEEWIQQVFVPLADQLQMEVAA